MSERGNSIVTFGGNISIRRCLSKFIPTHIVNIALT